MNGLNNREFKVCIIGGTSEARLFGERLFLNGRPFSLTLTVNPVVKYCFPVIVSKITGFELSGAKVRPIFENEKHEEVYDMILDFTHPHARGIDCAYSTLPESVLWSYRRIPCLNEDETVGDYGEMADRLIDCAAEKALCFLGHVGLLKLKKELSARDCGIRLYSRSIKPNEGASHIGFIPESMNKIDEIQRNIDEVRPDIAVLKDSGVNGGTPVKKDVLVKNCIPFIGMRMPVKKFGKTYYSSEKMYGDLMCEYEAHGGKK